MFIWFCFGELFEIKCVYTCYLNWSTVISIGIQHNGPNWGKSRISKLLIRRKLGYLGYEK